MLPEATSTMPLDLSFSEDENSSGDVIVTMEVPGRKHWKCDHQQAHATVVVVPSDSEDGEADDVTIVSFTPPSMNIASDTDDCRIESYKSAADSHLCMDSSSALMISPTKHTSSHVDALVNNGTGSINVCFSSCARSSYPDSPSLSSHALMIHNIGLPESHMDMCVSDDNSHGQTKTQSGVSAGQVMLSDSSLVKNCVVNTTSPSLLQSSSVNSGSSVLKLDVLPMQNHSIVFDMRPKLSHSSSNPALFSTFSTSMQSWNEQVSDIQQIGNIPGSHCSSTDQPSIPVVHLTEPGKVGSKSDVSVAHASGAFTPTASRASCLDVASWSASDFLVRDADHHPQKLSSANYRYSPPQLCDASSSFMRAVRSSRRHLDINLHPNSTASSSELLSAVVMPHKRRSVGEVCPQNRPVIKLRRFPSPPLDSSAGCTVKVKTAAESRQMVRCSSCGNFEASERLSQCMAGHPCCGACLQLRVKALLAGSLKGAIMCKHTGCQAYYLATQLRNSLPDIVIEILQEKLDREYCDDISRLQPADGSHVLGPGSSHDKDVTTRGSTSGIACDDDGLLDLPKDWENMSENECYRRVDLECGSVEYKWVSKMFHQTMTWPHIRLLRVQRVQNHALWQFYVVKRRQMQRESGEPVVEKQLFHGTSQMTVDAICANNFDWRLCGTHGTVYGQGSYFATEASYSHMYTDCVSGRPSRPLPPAFGGSLRIMPPPYHGIATPPVVPRTRFLDRVAGIVLHTQKYVGSLNAMPAMLPPGHPLPAHQPKVPIAGQHIIPHLLPAHQPQLLQSSSSAVHRVVHPSSSSASICPSLVSAVAHGIPVTVVSPFHMLPGSPAEGSMSSSFLNSRLPTSSVGGAPQCCSLSGSFCTQQPPSALHGCRLVTGGGAGFSLAPPCTNGCTNNALATSGLCPCHCVPHPFPPPAAHQSVPAGLPPPLNAVACPAHFLPGGGGGIAVDPGHVAAPASTHHVMFLARVLVGRSAVGRSEYRTPPPVDTSQPFGRCYDSCTNRAVNPSIYVIFNSSQCYPEYVIEYANDVHPSGHQM